MNRQRAKELLPIIKAYSEGKDIDRHINGEWTDVHLPAWYDEGTYRIAPSTTPRTIEDGLEVGDVIEDEEGDKRKILAVCGEIFAFSCIDYHDRHDDWHTLHEFLIGGYKLVQPETEYDTIEMTLEDAKRMAAYWKGVDVSKLRIKE